MTLSDFTKEFTVETDASEKRIGVVLSHAGRPVAFFNKGLSWKALDLSTYKKEMPMLYPSGDLT